jgi:hypothetical protein
MTLYRLTLENLNEPIPIETTILYCNRLRLAQLPGGIGNLTNLQILYCSDNQLQELPKTPRLRCKSVAGHSTCEWIGNLTNLQSLYCYDNQLQELPKTPVSTCEWIGNLSNLQFLSCDGNQLQKLPDNIGNLTNLQTLFCYNNQLQELPKTPVSTCESIGNLTNLRKISCFNNQFRKEFSDIIYKYEIMSISTHPWLDDNAQEMLQALRDAYLISDDNSYVLK